jgi:hypothetical protein
MKGSEIEVISPLGGQRHQEKSFAKRLDTLNGKTVCELWNADFKGDFTFPIYRELLKERFPDVKFIPYTEFPCSSLRGTPAHQRELDQRMAALAKEKGCDAVITGNGG